MTRKINWPILVTIVCVILFVGVLWYGFKTGTFSFSLSKKSNQTVQKEEEIKVNRTDYTDVARKTLDWIDKQRNADGWYILERGCDLEKKTCDTVWDNKEGNKDGLIATWARLNFYEQHKEAKDLEIVKKDIDIFYDKYKNDNLKDSLWICKITYEMAQSKYLDQGQKDKLKNLCLNVKYPSIEEVNKHWLSGRTEKITSMGKTKMWEKWDIYGITLRGFDASVGYPSDILFRYKWTKSKTDLDLARGMFDTIKKLYTEKAQELPHKQVIRYQEDLCLLMLSAIDLYKLDDKSDVLDFAKKIYSETILNKAGEYQTSICGLTTKAMWQLAKKNTFLVDLERNNKIIINIGMDGQNTKILNDDGFFKSDGKNRFVVYKNIVENGLIVESLQD